jgi:hypothetical protein
MSTQVAIIIVGALIAVMVVGHWKVVASTSAVQRLDRWTRDVTICWPLGNSSASAPSLRYHCNPQAPN